MTLAYERLDQFLQQLKTDVYSEVPYPLHVEISDRALDYLETLFQLKPGMRLLDVGCGQGVVVDRMLAKGLDYQGITLSDQDIKVCRAKGYRVDKMDQSFITYPDHSFDIVWARHVLEHSIFPLFTLDGYRRILKPDGIMYIEVPAPETRSSHENNPNHYSMFSKKVWQGLIERSGFAIVADAIYVLGNEQDSDQYWGFYCRLSAL